MTRPIRIEFPGALYHVTSRGNAKVDVFLDNEDRRLFLSLLGSVVWRYEWVCHAYCLMGNHYHLLIETPKTTLSKGMCRLNSGYASHVNQRHARAGHLFQARFHSVVVDKDAYLLRLARYVVLNPVRAGLVSSPGDWTWSSYLPTLGEVAVPDFLGTGLILSQFSDNEVNAREAYRRFVLEEVSTEVWQELKGGILVGSDDFVKRVTGLFNEKAGDIDFPREQRKAARKSLKEILSRANASRDELILEAYVIHAYRQREIGEYLGISRSRVTQILRERGSDN